MYEHRGPGRMKGDGILQLTGLITGERADRLPKDREDPPQRSRAYFILSILKSRTNERNNPEITPADGAIPVYTKVTCSGPVERFFVRARSRKVLCKYGARSVFEFPFGINVCARASVVVSLHTGKIKRGNRVRYEITRVYLRRDIPPTHTSVCRLFNVTRFT